MPAAQLLHLLQFASPALPIGGYSYSQALEAAIEQGEVHDAATAGAWIGAYLQHVIAQWDAPLCWRLMQAFSRQDARQVQELTERAIAARDTSEFRAESLQMGYSLRKLLQELAPDDCKALALLQLGDETPLPAAYACAVAALGIPHAEALLAMLFAWAENQVLVCVKSIPLGQVAGQKILLALALAPAIEAAARHARTVPDAGMNNWAPGLSLLSMQHEVQHGRIYRS